MKAAILGAGTIVPDFLTASALVEGIEPYAIFGQEADQEIMVQLSERYQIKKIYFDYVELLNDKEIELVYIALPNHLHAEYAKMALEKGKHVIVEKPLCPKLAEAKELYALGEEKACFLFEAVPTIHYPNFKKIKEYKERIGNIKIVEMNVSVNSDLL